MGNFMEKIYFNEEAIVKLLWFEWGIWKNGGSHGAENSLGTLKKESYGGS